VKTIPTCYEQSRIYHKANGRHREAIKLMAECVQSSNQVLGTEHPQALSSFTALAKWQNVE
jgi:Tetratricopeptide repeat